MGVDAGPTTEQRILDAATGLFYEKGYHAATMREIAAAVGIKAGSLYNHFPGKQELLARIAAGTMEELLEGGRAAIAPHESPSERLRALVVFHVAYHAERRLRAKVADDQLQALDPEHRRAVVAIRDEYEALLRELLEEGREREGWAVPDVRILTFAIWTMCTAVDTWYREDGRLTPGEIADIYASFVLAALEPVGSGTSAVDGRRPPSPRVP